MNRYIDMHCDTLSKVVMDERNDLYHHPDYAVDINRLLESKALLQFFAIFMETNIGQSGHGIISNMTDDDYIQRGVTAFDTTITKYSDRFVGVKTTEDVKKLLLQNDKCGGMLTIEDGRSVKGSFEKLEAYYQMGVRLISLTWNYANCFGSPNSFDKNIMDQGLTDFGKNAIEWMNHTGMCVDVSHLSDGGFWQVAQISKKPIIASHSNCRTLTPHPRNLSDPMLKAIGDSGGVLGINFSHNFLSNTPQDGMSRVDDMVRHILHGINVAGIESIALGGDLDGITSTLEIDSPLKMKLLFDQLRMSGISQDHIEKISYKNTARVLIETL